MERSPARPLAVALSAVLTCSSATAGYTVQLGAFADPVNAAQLAQRLEAAGVPVSTPEMTTAGGRRLTRVVAGPFPDRQTGEAALAAANLDRSAVPAADTATASPPKATRAAKPSPMAARSTPPRDSALVGGPKPADGATPVAAQPILLASSAPTPETTQPETGPDAAASSPRVTGFLQTEAGYIYSGDAHWE